MKKQIKTSDIKDKINTIYEIFDELKRLNAEAKKELSELDRELSNHYHTIEGVELDYMSDSHMLIMKMRDILNRRREAKINHTMLESFVSSLQNQIEKTKKRNNEIIDKHKEILQEIKDRAK